MRILAILINLLVAGAYGTFGSFFILECLKYSIEDDIVSAIYAYLVYGGIALLLFIFAIITLFYIKRLIRAHNKLELSKRNVVMIFFGLIIGGLSGMLIPDKSFKEKEDCIRDANLNEDEEELTISDLNEYERLNNLGAFDYDDEDEDYEDEDDE